MRVQREEIFRFEEIRQIGLEDRQPDVQTFQAETDQIVCIGDHQLADMARIGDIIRVADTDEGVHVRGAERESFEGDVIDVRVIRRDVAKTFDDIDHRTVRRRQSAFQQRFDSPDLRWQTGVQGALEGLADIQLEVTAQVHEVAQVQVQIREFDAAEQAQIQVQIEAERQMEILDEVEWIRHAEAEVQVRQARQGRQEITQTIQTDGRENSQTWQLRQREIEVEIRIEREQTEQTKMRVQADPEQIAVVVECHARTRTAGRHHQLTAIQRGVIQIHRWGRVATQRCRIQVERQIGGTQRQIWIGTDQRGRCSGGGHAIKIDAFGGCAWREFRGNQRQYEIQVADRQTERMRAGQIEFVDDAIAVHIRETRWRVNPGEAVDVGAGDDQCATVGDDFRAECVEANMLQRLFLEGETALQGQNSGDAHERVANRSADHGVLIVQHHRCRATGRNAVTGTVIGFRQIGDKADPAALVDIDVDIVDREFYEVAKTHQRSVPTMRFDSGKARWQRRQIDADHALGVQDGGAKIQIVDHQTDRIRIRGIGTVDDAVMITVDEIRTVDAGESTQTMTANFDTRCMRTVEGGAKRPFDGDVDIQCATEREVTGDVQELRNL